MVKNLSLWNQVEKTNTNSTKAVSFGRKFTAIDAMYQIKKCTEMFGSIGIGWGVREEKYDFTSSIGNVIYIAEFWYIWEEKEGFLPMVASISLTDKKGKFDDEAVKKVQTDALTKAISKLGFNADVFMGKFDDNKYIDKLKKEELEAEKEKEKLAELNKPVSLSSQLIKKLKDAKITDMKGFAATFNISSSDISSLEKYFSKELYIDKIIPFYSICKENGVEDVSVLITEFKLELKRIDEMITQYNEFQKKENTDIIELINVFKSKKK